MIRVFIVEDSATVRRHLQNVFRAAGDFHVVGVAATAEAAIESIPRLKADLVTLDVFLPDEPAAEVVRKLSAHELPPIVLLSEAPRDTTEVFDALAAGAIDFMRKPRAGDESSSGTLLNALRALSRARPLVKPVQVSLARPPEQAFSVVVIVASTGGPSALNQLFPELPADFSLPIVIAQHMAEGFEEGMARWFGQISPLKFEVVDQRATLQPGHVLLGRANTDLVIRGRGEVISEKAPPLGYHPSGDALIKSAAAVYGSESVAVVMSGIGSDGAVGAASLKAAGGFIMSQSAASSVVYGMPKAVAEAGLASYVGSPRELAHCLIRCTHARTSTSPQRR